MEKVKHLIDDARDQIRSLWKVLGFLYIPIVCLFVLLNSISRSSNDITLSYFTRDTTAVGGVPFYAGLVSQIGGLLWSAALAVCLFVFAILKNRPQATPSSRRFLLHAALLTGVLMVDDFFLFHEDIGPDYLNIGEKAIVLAYLLFTVVFLLVNRREILASEFLLLGLALAIFGTSIFLDAANLDAYEEYGVFFSEQFQIFLEDGLKFTGVATWLAYFVRYGYQRITTRDRQTLQSD
jgi:ABC-type cobalamin transport system permease subunit